MVDRALGLRAGAGEVEDQPFARPRRPVGRLGQGDPLGVQPRRVDPVVLGVVLPDVARRPGSSPGSRAGRSRVVRVHDRVEAGLDGLRGRTGRTAPPSRRAPIRQAEHSASRSAASDVGHPRVAGHDASAPPRWARPASHSLIGGTIRPSSNTLVARDRHRSRAPRRRCRRGGRTPARTRRPRLARRSEHRHGDAQVRQVADAALGQVDVVVEEHVARAASSSSGKSRATGCTSAEYERPVSLRSCRSWMPARKSWASRIIGDRDGPRDRGLDLHLDRRARCRRRSPRAPGRPLARRRSAGKAGRLGGGRSRIAVIGSLRRVGRW